MKSVWKHESLSSISFLKPSIPFHSGIFYIIPYRNFRSIPFHTMPWLSILYYHYYYCNILPGISRITAFYPTVVATLKIRKRLILKKLLPLPAPFQHFRFRVRFCFQPLSSKCFRFHKKLTASTASASIFRFRFHIPGSNMQRLQATIIVPL